jgi:hypothetical protein
MGHNRRRASYTVLYPTLSIISIARDRFEPIFRERLSAEPCQRLKLGLIARLWNPKAGSDGEAVEPEARRGWLPELGMSNFRR